MTRNSKQKETILRILRGTTSHPTADWIYEEVRKEIPGISLGTVYRNLKMLQQEGRVSELDLAGTVRRFNGHVQNHYHLMCERCGCVVDVGEPVNKGLDKRVARKTGFKVSRHILEFRGVCKDCQS